MGADDRFAPTPGEERLPGYAAGIRAAARLVQLSAGGGFDGAVVDRDLDVCDELIRRLAWLADQAGRRPGQVAPGDGDVEFGIRLLGSRPGRVHRTGMTEAQARDFADPAEWPNDVDPAEVFEIVCRDRGPWRKADLT